MGNAAAIEDYGRGNASVSGETKLTLRLSPDARKTLEEIAHIRGGVSFAEVVRRALGTELFIIKEQENGSRILIEDKGENIKQLVLR